VQAFDIYGTLALGSGNSPFTFNYPVYIIVTSHGIIQFLTSNPTLLIPSSSIIILYTGGLFSTTGVVIQTYTSAGLGESITLNSTFTTGPLICVILPNGIIITFDVVLFVVIQSGSFTLGSTYLGGIAPTADVCNATSSCYLYISSGYTLSTADLNGLLNMRFDLIYVASGATLQLGTPGSSAGFRFIYPIQLDVSGTAAFVGAAGGIYIPENSAINLFSGSTSTSVVVTFFQVYNPSTNANVGQPLPVPTFFSGPSFITVSANGVISINTIGMNEISDFHFILNRF